MSYKGNIITNKAKSSAFKMNEALMEGAKFAAGTGVDYSKAASEGFKSFLQDSGLSTESLESKVKDLEEQLKNSKKNEYKVGSQKAVNTNDVVVEQVEDKSAARLRKTTKGKGRNFRSVEEGAGMTEAGVKKYRKDNPGSKLKTAVTKCDVKVGTKAYNRQKAFCSRSKSWTGERGRAARKRWCCSRF